MSLPNFVKDFVKESIDFLDPYNNFSSQIKLYHNEIHVKGFEFKIENNLHIFALGKASVYEAKALLDILKDQKIYQTVCLTKENHTIDDDRIIQLEGTHPVLSEKNILESKKFLEYLNKVKKDDSVIFLLSGGGSALLEVPRDNLTFKELQKIHIDLLNSGKNINEMNKKRKELSLVKDGGLLNFIKTKNILQFVTCDIPNESLSDVSSGPLLGSDKTLWPKTVLGQGASLLLEKVKMANPSFYIDKIYDDKIDNVIKEHVRIIESSENIISAGEATIEIPKEHGLGGRNTHFVLAMACELYKNEKNKDVHIMSFGTDGTDGPTDCAGAYINYKIYIENDFSKYLKTFNSYEYFKKVGTLIKTGPTKTNVMDLRCLWREK